MPNRPNGASSFLTTPDRLGGLVKTNMVAFFSDDKSSSSGSTLPSPPKRSLNVFAIFVKDRFKLMPSDMPIKEKFVKVGEEWRSLPVEQKEHYKKQMADGFVQYRQEMANYIESLSPEQLVEYKKQIKV